MYVQRLWAVSFMNAAISQMKYIFEVSEQRKNVWEGKILQLNI